MFADFDKETGVPCAAHAPRPVTSHAVPRPRPAIPPHSAEKTQCVYEVKPVRAGQDMKVLCSEGKRYEFIMINDNTSCRFV